MALRLDVRQGLKTANYGNPVGSLIIVKENKKNCLLSNPVTTDPKGEALLSLKFHFKESQGNTSALIRFLTNLWFHYLFQHQTGNFLKKKARSIAKN